MLTGTHGRPAAGSKALEGVRLCLPEPCAGSAFVGGPGVTVFAFLPLAILQESATRCRRHNKQCVHTSSNNSVQRVG